MFGATVWIDENGQKYIVWQVPDNNIYMRYKATDSEINAFFSQEPPTPRVVTNSDEDWISSHSFGDIKELPKEVRAGETSPFVSFAEQFAATAETRPWIVEDDEMFGLWVQGIVEDRTITPEEWSTTKWWDEHSYEQRQWLELSEGKDINDPTLSEDAKRFIKDNEIYWRNQLLNAGVSNVDQVVNASGQTLGQWFASKNTIGDWTDDYAEDQAEGLGDKSLGIQRDTAIDDWLVGASAQLATTQEGKAAVTALAFEWLGPLYGKLDNSKIDDLAALYRNAESSQVGLSLVQDKLKAMRLAIFPGSIYDSNLTYEDIAAPWRPIGKNIVGGAVDESSSAWLNGLKSNNQDFFVRELTVDALNKGNTYTVDRVTDDMANFVGAGGITRGVRGVL